MKKHNFRYFVLVGRFVGWLVSRSDNWLVSRSVGWWIGWLAGRSLIYCFQHNFIYVTVASISIHISLEFLSPLFLQFFQATIRAFLALDSVSEQCFEVTLVGINPFTMTINYHRKQFSCTLTFCE